MNSGERCLTGPAVKEFCEYYVHNFLHSRNMKDIEVTFDSTGGLGTFIDNGNSVRINVNLQKLRKIGSYTELAMTLSHELTHATDSAKNKQEGKFNRDDGTGLIDAYDLNISDIGATGEVKNLLVDMKRVCYIVDPNERSGRIGELSALLFMQKVGSGDKNIQAEIKESVARYIKYQQKTIDTLNSVSEKIENFKARIVALKEQGLVSENSATYQIMQKQLKYIERNGLNVSVEKEIESQEAARRILEQREQERQNESRKKEQEMIEMEESGRQM